MLSRTLGGWQVICWALVIALPFVLLPAFLYRPVDWNSVPLSVNLAFLYLALISQLLGFFVWYKGLAMGGVSRVSQTQLLQPFITIIASVFLLGEMIDMTTIIFALMVGSVVMLGNKMKIKHATNPEQVKVHSIKNA